MYTIQERAMPSLIDGLKPVQRFVLYSAIKSAMRDFKKVAATGSVVSEYGYNHGEVAAVESLALMSNTWSNNYPLLEGRGNFGSRAVQDGAAARYIFTKVHDNFHALFKDSDLAPPHRKPEYSIPQFYLPVLPFVLFNGVSGIATGFGTKILPHCPKSVKECVQQVLDTGTCDEPKVKFPKFMGKIDQSGDQWFIEGLYELQGKTKLLITEIPVRFDRVKYVTLLDSLVDKDAIVGYDELRGEGEFTFRVTLKRDFDCTHENIIKVFKLRQNISQNINVIDENEQLKHYDKASELIVDFVAARGPFLQKRIDVRTVESLDAWQLAEEKVAFIKLVRTGEIDFVGIKRSQLVELLIDKGFNPQYVDQLAGMSIYQMTDDEVARLEKAAKQAKADHEYWTKTTVAKQFKQDLKDLKL